ncbi:unnamed protein product, partial [Symbiodinium pilosum]
MTEVAQNLQRNDIYNLCNVTLQRSYADARVLNWLLRAFGTIDLLHVDIQGAEDELLDGTHLLSNVKQLHIGTHGREIHRQCRGSLLSHGFTLDVDYPPRTFVRSPYGPLLLDDGILAGRQPQSVTRDDITSGTPTQLTPAGQRETTRQKV